MLYSLYKVSKKQLCFENSDLMDVQQVRILRSGGTPKGLQSKHFKTKVQFRTSRSLHFLLRAASVGKH